MALLSLSLSLYTHTPVCSTFTHSFMRTSQRKREMMRDRYGEKKERDGKDFDVLNIFCVHVSNSSHQNVREEVQKRLHDG